MVVEVLIIVAESGVRVTMVALVCVTLVAVLRVTTVAVVVVWVVVELIGEAAVIVVVVLRIGLIILPPYQSVNSDAASAVDDWK